MCGGANKHKQFDGLAALVSRQLQLSAQLGDWLVFIFISTQAHPDESVLLPSERVLFLKLAP